MMTRVLSVHLIFGLIVNVLYIVMRGGGVAANRRSNRLMPGRLKFDSTPPLMVRLASVRLCKVQATDSVSSRLVILFGRNRPELDSETLSPSSNGSILPYHVSR